jgi:L-ascorbate metabolism protein UlaG (beta-lactamase superfamily)
MSVSIKSLAHAGFQIEGGGKIIYVDLEKHCNPVKGADIILVTHSHHDHCDPQKIKKVRTAETVVVAPEDCGPKIGDIMSLNPGEKTTLGGITITAVQAYNNKRFRSPGNPFHPKGLGVGYLITVDGKTIYHAGDTDFIPEMKEIGHVDVALLPTGDTYTMDAKEGAEAALALGPGVVIPMHTWGNDMTVFKEMVEGSGTAVVILQEGEEYQV